MARRILVVEDDEKSRKLLCDVLDFHGYEVVAVESGEQGLAEAIARAPDAALLDIQLPGINGFEVIAALRAGGVGERLPVIAVTASVMDQDRRRIFSAGFDAYIAKPVNIRQLIDTLQRLLEQVNP
jgi:two-component system cell cycle response regulator DivK